MAEEAARRLELEPDLARAIVDFQLGMRVWDPNGALTPANVQGTLDFLVEIGSLEPGLTAEEVADLSYLEAVLAEVGRR